MKSVLAMAGRSTSIDFPTPVGTSVQRIRKELAKHGVKTRIAYHSPERLAMGHILYYPKTDHYVTVERIFPKRVAVNDSDRNKVTLLTWEQLLALVKPEGKRVWVIEPQWS